MMKKRIIIGISGASGVIYGIRLLQVLKDDLEIETHLVLTKGGKLNMGFGTGGNSHRGELEFASNISGSLKNTYHWPIAQVMAILKLASSGTCTMSIADVGALEIKVDSGLGTYSYVLPAKS